MERPIALAENLKHYRTKSGLTQKQLAEQIGYTEKSVSKWENDQSAPDTLNLIRLADLLETDSEYIATGRHTQLKSSPTVITMVQKVDNVVEKIIEKPVEIEKIVEVERVVEKVVEVPRVKKVVRIKYLRNPLEFALVAVCGFLGGLIVGLIF